MGQVVRGNPTFQNLATFLNNNPQSSLSAGAIVGGCLLGSLDGACTERLLLQCASALESNDVTLAQQVMWVLNNVASATGDAANQRLTSWFLRALVSRAARVYPKSYPMCGGGGGGRVMAVTELAGYVDLIPWYRFGFCAANSAILEAVQGCAKVHILDFSVTHCMQWPTLIDALADRPEGPPSSLRLSVPSWRPPVPPLLSLSAEEVGLRLANFAKSRSIPFQFSVIDINNGGLGLFEDADEALVVNCQNWLRYLPCRQTFLDTIKCLNPTLITVIDEDADLDAPSLSSRIVNCFNYLWIIFDSLETFLSKDSQQRTEYEADVGQKIENIIGFEGGQRIIERLESSTTLSTRMRNSGFVNVPFSEETVKEVKFMLDEHASGWGMKKKEDGTLVLTWKGHSSVYATTWVPPYNNHSIHDISCILESDHYSIMN
ncbi:PREDICTED: scarecrow-like protein 32 [Ipomoea nil]|uniref:scarecrow-like protein 32 n=1 Tax=Ipomoea nil TaxID=35883 RepID=UPI000901D6DA|nr:PREDICTED: scarecrow-like protein 32 [Ipomoea nil]